jgi:hypothetical protein
MEQKIKTAENLVKVLRKLNPHVQFDVKPDCALDSARIYGNIPGENLILPGNVFYNEKWGLNNGLSRGSMDYQNILYVYDIKHFSL